MGKHAGDCIRTLRTQYVAPMDTASTERKPGLFARLFGNTVPEGQALYETCVAQARRPIWYARLGVVDSIDGRFDMVVLVLSLVLLRFEREGEAGALPSVLLTEVFIDDMDGQVREIGFGDLVVGKQVGGILSVLGGRLGVYRDAVDAAALRRTLWRGTPPDDATVAAMVDEVATLRGEITSVPLATLLAGRLR